MPGNLNQGIENDGIHGDSQIRQLLLEILRRHASDLHLTAGERPKLRIDGVIVDSEVEQVLSGADTERLAAALLTTEQMGRFKAENELDFSFGIEGISRFRGNVYRQRGCVALAVRQIPFEITPLEELKVPPVVGKLAERPRGLILVTGPTGSGKSTTLAAIVDRINRERRGHILTIEDPIEFIHPHRGCLINQREVGSDTASFAAALKYALRQDPDVILVGELRDLETIQAALTIAETGHLCLATLHTNSAVESINRMIDVFPPHQQAQVRTQLAFVLEGVITQQLLPRIAGGRTLACEVMICTPAVRACIREGKLHQIYSLMQTGRQHGMQTLSHALRQLYEEGEVALQACLTAGADPQQEF